MEDQTLSTKATWRLAKSIISLRKQIYLQAPMRSKAFDGTIGDSAHQMVQSDHNPWVWDHFLKIGVVTAVDITHDPQNGCDCHAIARSLQENKDIRIKYIIWDRRIFSSYSEDGIESWAWRSYDGKNPHQSHIHISVSSNLDLADLVTPWIINTL